MRKILTLLGVLALAFGVWAEDAQKYTYQYRFEVACYDVAGSHIFPDDTIAMLVDTRMQEGKYKVLAYTSMSEVGKGQGVYFDHTELAKEIPSDIFVNQNHQILSAELTDNPYVEGETRYVDLLVNLRSDTALGVEYLGSGLHSGSAHDLEVVIFSRTSGLYQTLPNLLWQTEMSVGVSTTFAPVVPEPTSGLLLLMGFAGLMLKRKKAA